MATYTPGFLTGAGSAGCGITITSVSGAGTCGTIHVCGTGIDEVWLWAYNSATADQTLSIEWGTSALPRTVTIPYKAGLVPVSPGIRVPVGFKIQAYAGSSGVIVVDGNVNNIT
jgi:hypothetical protein